MDASRGAPLAPDEPLDPAEAPDVPPEPAMPPLDPAAPPVPAVPLPVPVVDPPCWSEQLAEEIVNTAPMSTRHGRFRRLFMSVLASN